MKEKEKKGSHLDPGYTVETARLKYCFTLIRLRPEWTKDDSFGKIKEAMPGGVPTWLIGNLISMLFEKEAPSYYLLEHMQLFSPSFCGFMMKNSHTKPANETAEAQRLRTGIIWPWEWWAHGVTETAFRKKAKDSFNYHLDQYVRLEKEKMRQGEITGPFPKANMEQDQFKQMHFEWLVRRTVIPSPGKPKEKWKDILGRDGDFSNERYEITRLAKFIGLPLKKGGPSVG